MPNHIAEQLLVLPLAALCVFALTVLIRRIALSRGVMDIPNGRSSHVVPTPRGGGLAIVLVYCAFVAMFGRGQTAEVGIVLASLLTGIIGMADDVKSQPARIRLSIHILSAAVVVYAVGGLPPIDFGFGPIDMGWAGYLVATLGAVWMINLTNFMDGIDAIVASQCAIASSIALALMLSTKMPADSQLATGLLAACILGFLVLNLPPAKIFMGDVGSGTLGLMVSGLMLWHTQFDAQWLYVWLILMGVLVVDASFTLLVRALDGRPVWEGHRSHAYQKLAIKYDSHLHVTALSGLISVVWLTPLAALVANHQLNGIVGMLLAYTPLIGVAMVMKAGKA